MGAIQTVSDRKRSHWNGRAEALCSFLGLVLLGLLVVWPSGDLSAQQREREYRIGPKDVLKVTVWGHEDLTRIIVVSAEGTFAFPLIGDVPAAGSTPTQLETRLKELLGKDYLVDPQVAVSIQEYRSQRVFVLGEVLKPGTYPLSGDVSLLDILSQAGGAAKTAGNEAVIVRGPKSEAPRLPGSAGSTTLKVNLKKLLEGDLAENVMVQDGDTVHIPKLASTSFYVVGEVKKPGAYVVEKEATTVLEALTLAGGFTERAAASGAKILRKRADGAQETLQVDLAGEGARANNTILVEGDTLVIPMGNIFYVLGEVQRPGAYYLDQVATAIGAIALAGGFTQKAAPNRTKIIRTHKDGKQETLVVDLNDVIKRGRKEKDVPLLANDVIIVPESFF